MQGVPRFTAEGRLKMLKFLKNAGISAGYLVESIHGAGSPEVGGDPWQGCAA
ncbi:4-hydroxyphenylacetate 3-hydroxylase C-terminal domain-containing protein [Vulcanisaeta sp. JCM 16159]|uniref:4-hydroxyphenylacetate 3-hydroxylase C-terminal domain-containing protein n=1 Tax=Vulcanisaeta sp. JCM 16159 TaxID=1295371 RepID=UPI0034677E5B